MKRIYLVSLIICISIILSGCKEDESLSTYRAQMEGFFALAASYDRSINSIDVTSDNYTVLLLDQLDGLNTLFADMASYEVPKQFSSIEDLAKEASENMSEAVNLYHQAYDNGAYEPTLEEAAKQYYERANLRIQYILMILHGETPQNNTTVTP